MSTSTTTYAHIPRDGSIVPQAAGFMQLADQQRVIPVVRRLLTDGLTPVSVYQGLAKSRPGTFLLESAEQDGQWTRYSFIGVRHAAQLVGEDGQATWHGRVPSGLDLHGDSVEMLRQSLAVLHTPAWDDLPPLTGGLVGILGYDMVRNFERIPTINPDELHLPEMAMMLSTDMAVYDHRDDSLWLIANAINFDGGSQGARRAYDDACARLESMTEDLLSAVPVAPVRLPEDAELDVHPRTTPAEYQDAVNTAVEHIRAGDAFQIVVSQRFDAPFAGDPLNVYRVLRATNPSPYMYLIRVPDADNDSVAFDVVGASPESLVTLHQGRARLHPIAGTRPRGVTTRQDMALAEELLADEKERSEHVMLVDLGRNDLGRVCLSGSVDVVEFMRVERFSHVMHIVSTVVGDVADGYTAIDVLAATFPAGTLSGAPKPKAMEIIENLEPARRGVYAGCVGYIDFAGNMDTAIAIRTAVLRQGVAHVQAGAGIVADSDPETEHQECVNKARAVIHALAVAGAMT